MSNNKHWHWNFFYDKYPYTDFHELNLDWLIESIHYWYVCIRKLQDAIGLNNEDHNRYWSKDYKEGALVWYKDGWKRLLHDVKEGDIIDCSDFESISVEELLAEERAARIAADDKERAERIAADNALDDRIDKEIADRTAADNNLQAQITSNDNDIANHETRITTLEGCCDDAKKTLADHEARITNNTNNITNNTNSINNLDNRITNIVNGSTSQDTNTITQLTYHEWRGTIFNGPQSGGTGRTTRAAMIEVATKVNEIVAAGGHAELCRLQFCAGTTNNEAALGVSETEFLNSGFLSYTTIGVADSSVIEDVGIRQRTISSISDANSVQEWYWIQANNAWTGYRNMDLDLGYSDDGYYHQFRLIYQTADYKSA